MIIQNIMLSALLLLDYRPLLASAFRKFNFPLIISAIIGPIKLLKLCYFHLIIWYVKFSTCSKEILRLWLVLCEVTSCHPCHHRQSELIQVLKTCTYSLLCWVVSTTTHHCTNLTNCTNECPAQFSHGTFLLIFYFEFFLSSLSLYQSV